MHSARVFAFVAPSLLFVASSLGACDDSSGGGGSGDFDSGPSGFEAGPTAEGAAPDASFDGAKLDGAMGTGVSVTVGDATSPKADVRVVFQDATGAILGEAKTDAAGVAVSIALPSMVTVLYAPPAGAPTAVTFLGVNDGDMLRVVPTSAVLDATLLGDISVPFTANAITAKAGFVYAYANNTSCMNFGMNPILVHLEAACAHTANTIFVEADDSTSTLGFGLAKNVASPAGGSTVSVPSVTVTAAGTRTLAATNLPADGQNGGSAWAVSGTDMHFLPSTDALITDPGGLTLYVPRDSVDGFQTEVSTTSPLGGGASTTAVVQREAATTAATGAFTSVDFSTTLPVIAGASATTNARPAVTITTTAAPTAAAAAYARISWGTASTWTFVMPGNTTTFTAPALPADAVTFTPSGAVAVEAVGYAGGPLLTSYAAFKALPVPTETLPALMDDQQVLPTIGLLKVATWELVTD